MALAAPTAARRAPALGAAAALWRQLATAGASLLECRRLLSSQATPASAAAAEEAAAADASSSSSSSSSSAASSSASGSSSSASSSSSSASSSSEPPLEQPDTVDFGFRSVPRSQKVALVGEVFSSVADSYDLMNDVMSAGLHRLWKDRLVDELRPFPGMRHLDVAGGTGDVAFRVLRAIRTAEQLQQQAATRAQRQGHTTLLPGAPPPLQPQQQPSQPQQQPPPPPQQQQQQAGPQPGQQEQQQAAPEPGHVTVCDINPDMLRVGQERARAQGLLHGLSWLQGDAEALPLPDGCMDAYTIAFGIRNVTDRDAALREAARVLRRGGRLLCLEFSRVTNPLLGRAYDAYSFAAIPRLGGLVAGDADSYAYLVESIRRFPDQEAWAAQIRGAGFKAVTYESLTGGVVAIHSGFKL